jgi:hypothetical protein
MTDLNYAVYSRSLLNRLKGLIVSGDNYNRRSIRTMELTHA